jgi:hypothetical protein
MPIVKQLSVFIENKPGRLSGVCTTLADAGVNIQAMSVHEYRMARNLIERPCHGRITIPVDEGDVAGATDEAVEIVRNEGDCEAAAAP